MNALQCVEQNCYPFLLLLFPLIPRAVEGGNHSSRSSQKDTFTISTLSKYVRISTLYKKVSRTSYLARHFHRQSIPSLPRHMNLSYHYLPK